MVKPRKKKAPATRQTSIPSEIPQFNESRFKSQVTEATESIKRILPQGRKLKYIGDVDHTYADKFLLAEFLANSTLAALLNCLEHLGINEENIKKIQEWVKSNKTVTIRFSGDEKCSFSREKKRVEEPSTVYQTEYSTSIVKGLVRRASKIFTTLTDYYWRYDVNYELSVYPGNQTDSKIVLKSSKSRYELVTSSNNAPRPKASLFDAVEANITWLFALLNEKQQFKFAINRDKKSCRTPRRNKEILSFFENATKLYEWFEHFNLFFYQIFNIQATYDLDMKSINDNDIFVPVTPFIDAKRKLKKKRSHQRRASAIFQQPFDHYQSQGPFGDMNEFLQTQKSSILSKFDEIKKLFPKARDLVAADEVCLRIISLHGKKIIYYFATSLDSLENLLERQLVSAIGKKVSPADFKQYMTFHYRKLFLPQYQPAKFAYPIRRPNYSPEGIISIGLSRQIGSKIDVDPITTIVHKSIATKPMKFPLNASSNVSFLGERYLHGYIDHQFSTTEVITANLKARARQFSSFILLVGRIGGIDLFEPKYAIIVENKDDLTIPLNFETIPSAKEFKEAIVSLSKEQQDFSTAYRSMQLESTLFGICVIQIKPLLEKVLNLPPMSLTKEIKLTQELFNLFNNFQIPSDLLSFEGDPNLPVAEKLNQVKKQVKEMNEMINEKKEEEILEAKMESVMQNENLIIEPDCIKLDTQNDYFSCDDMLQTASLASYDGNTRVEFPDIDPHSRLELFCAPSQSMNVEYCDQEFKLEKKGKKAPQKKKKMKKINESVLEKKCEFPDVGGSKLVLADECAPAPKKEEKKQEEKKESKVSDSKDKEKAKEEPVVKNDTPAPPSTENAQDANVAPTSGETDKPPEKENKEKDDEKIIQFGGEEGGESTEGLVDYTQVPNRLESLFEKLDGEGAIRPTIINPLETWDKISYKNILASAQESKLVGEDQERERNRAFDLLDALTKSGAISVDDASLHVVVAATHCFDKSIMDSLVIDNVNPIQRVERTALIVSSVIQGASPASLIKDTFIQKIQAQSPELFDL